MREEVDRPSANAAGLGGPTGSRTRRGSDGAGSARRPLPRRRCRLLGGTARPVLHSELHPIGVVATAPGANLPALIKDLAGSEFTGHLLMELVSVSDAYPNASRRLTRFHLDEPAISVGELRAT